VLAHHVPAILGAVDDSEPVAVVGGGNSAGQATVFLAGRARRVSLIVRRPLPETMSQYLVERITGLPNVDVIVGCEVAELHGAAAGLDGVSIRERASGAIRRVPARFLFSFIGADPNTDWLGASGLKLDPRGFVLTGDEAGEGRLPHETSRRGVFAVGDVRAGSVKRVAAAVGDGAQVVAAIHSYIANSAAKSGVPIEPMQVTVTA
jgi:thioredoxin reductase (NADPH)